MGFPTNPSSLNGEILENPWLFFLSCSSKLLSFHFLRFSPLFKMLRLKMLSHQYVSFPILFTSPSLNQYNPGVVFYKKYIILYFSVALVRVVAMDLCQIFRVSSLLYHKEMGSVVIECFSASTFSEYSFNFFSHRGGKAAVTSASSTKRCANLNNRSMLPESTKVIVSKSFQRAPNTKKIFQCRKSSNSIKIA